MALSKEERARYEITLDRERWRLEKNKDYSTFRSLTLIAGIFGALLLFFSLIGGAVFLVAAYFCWTRWQAMERTYRESQEIIERYQYIIDSESKQAQPQDPVQ